MLLRNQSDILREMSAQEVANCRRDIAPGDNGRRRYGKAPKSIRRKVEAMLADREFMKKLRGRLSSTSRLTQSMKQRVARKFNVQE